MNFSLPPRPTNNQSHGYGRNYRRNPTWGLGSGYHAVDKARYVHANYRFIVDPRGDYRAQSVDADIHLDWNNVLQILASELSQEASCPICLGTPVAPRMARCGHIFCLPCLIRYMQSEDEGKAPEKKARSKKCPLCFDTIYASETRPVRWYTGQEGEPPREGGDVVLRLVVRPAGSTLAMPRDGADALAKDEDIPWYHAAEVMDYARVMRGGEDYMLEQLDQEIVKLEQQGKEDEVMFAEDSMEWTKKAIRSIREAKEKLKGIGNPPEEPAKPAEPKMKRAPIVFEEGAAPEMYTIQNASKSGQDFTAAQNSSESGPAQDKDRTMSVSSHSSVAGHDISLTLAELRNRQQHEHHKTPSEYFFYQALLHYYLSPLDIRILKALSAILHHFLPLSYPASNMSPQAMWLMTSCGNAPNIWPTYHMGVRLVSSSAIGPILSHPRSWSDSSPRSREDVRSIQKKRPRRRRRGNVQRRLNTPNLLHLVEDGPASLKGFPPTISSPWPLEARLKRSPP